MRRFSLLFLLLLSLALSACLRYHVDQSASNKVSLGNGEILLARAVPGVVDLGPKSQLRAMGFLPSGIYPTISGPWLEISRDEKLVRLMNGADVVREIVAEGVSRLQPGNFSIVLKQRAPLWYAPDSYFSNRALPLPKSGDQDRYRRGALGEFALFIAENIPLHSGPVDTDEVGGVRILSGEDMSRVYYTLAIGSSVVVK
jgi:hypothetical protein